MAIPVLQWQMGGSFLVLIMWPMGVMFLAKNKGLFCIITDALWSIVYFVIIYFGWDYWGFNILGIAYVAACIVKLISVIISTKYLGDFLFSKINIRYITIFGAATLVTLLNALYVTNNLQYITGSILIISSIYYSYSQLSKIIDIKMIIFTKILKR